REMLASWLEWNRVQTGLPLAASFKYLLRDGLWFCWPALPFALWSVYAWRRQRAALHIVLPVSFFAVLALLACLNPHVDQSNLLPLLPPLAVLAAFGLPTMKRGAINAIDWFAVMALTTGAAFFWLAWWAMLSGWPARLHKNVLRLVPGYTPTVDWLAVLVAASVTIAWVLLVHWRISRRPSVLWRAVVLSSGGVILMWALWMTLFLQPNNYSRSYAQVAHEARASLPAGTDCVETNVTLAQRASFAYFAQLPFAAPGQRCAVALILDSTRVRDEVELVGTYRVQGWRVLWEGRRPGDKVERFRLLHKPAP
ncbi:MAG TPA: glycosyltransferase, partial [Burkholderiaceae bacterium]